MSDLVDKLDEMISKTDKMKELIAFNNSLKDELLSLSKKRYQLLCNGILNMYWYAMAGDTEKYMATFWKLVEIADEGIKDEKNT